MESNVTAHEVAVWMFEELKRKGELYQTDALDDIEKKFGKQFTYLNENLNSAIDREVLAEFRKLSRDSVVWEREDRYWRIRQAHDKPGRQQD